MTNWSVFLKLLNTVCIDNNITLEPSTYGHYPKSGQFWWHMEIHPDTMGMRIMFGKESMFVNQPMTDKSDVEGFVELILNGLPQLRRRGIRPTKKQSIKFNF